MVWTLIFILSVNPIDVQHVGYFDTYEKCHAEAVWQTNEGVYKEQWACVQIKQEK